MIHRRTRHSARQVGIASAVVTAAALAFALPSGASATPCGTSTPSTNTIYDSAFDGDAGLSPEISSLTATVDGACNITVSLGLDSLLISGDSHAIYMDVDGNPATGNPTFDGSDVAVLTVGRSGRDDNPVLQTWNGAQWTGATQLVATANSWGFTTRIDTLGIANPATITVQAGAMYQGIYNNYFDWAPDVGLPPMTLPVTFAAPVPVAPAPAPVPAAAAPAPTGPTPACITAKSALSSVTATIITTQRQRAKATTTAARKKANKRLKALAVRKKKAAADVTTACAA